MLRSEIRDWGKGKVRYLGRAYDRQIRVPTPVLPRPQESLAMAGLVYFITWADSWPSEVLCSAVYMEVVPT